MVNILIVNLVVILVAFSSKCRSLFVLLYFWQQFVDYIQRRKFASFFWSKILTEVSFNGKQIRVSKISKYLQTLVFAVLD